jgi:hypothetical protein
MIYWILVVSILSIFVVPLIKVLEKEIDLEYDLERYGGPPS